MKFVSDILAKAGLVVDGVVTFNNTATGQTPDANDNSTKLATTAWVQNYVVPYSLPTASASILGGIKVGTGLAIDGSGVLSVVGGGGSSSSAFKSEQTFVATAGQTTFTFVDGYTPNYTDVFLNGVYLNKTEYTASNGETVILDDACLVNDIVTIISYSPYIVGETPAARNICRITATDGQTSFACNYAVGQVDVFYNGSKLDISEFTATDGENIVLATAAELDDKIEIVTWLVGGGIAATRTITINGVTYDLSENRTWTTLPSNGTTGQILAKASNTSYDTVWIDNYANKIQHTVKLGETMTIGTPVYVPISQDAGTNMTVMKASNASETTSSKTMGLIALGGSSGDFVQVITEGLLAGLNTASASKGDPVWLGVNGALIFGLTNKPVAPAHLVFIGIVTRAQSNNGEIFVKVQNGFEMGELHDYVQNGVQDNYVISYESSTSLYKPKSIATLLGYTPANPANYLALTGGTLTGTLNGTAATFTGNIRSGGLVGAVNIFNLYKSDNTTLGGQLAYDSSINQLYLWNDVSTGYFSIYVNSYERLKIESNGLTTISGTTVFNSSVGIGIASPSSKLHIYADNDRAALRIQNTAANKIWELLPAVSGISNSGLSIYNVTDDRTPFHVTDSGFIGIGITSPIAPLHVYSNNQNMASDAASSYTYAKFRLEPFNTSSVGVSMGLISPNINYLQTSYSNGSSSPLVINPYGGNVGIGTISTASKLTIAPPAIGTDSTIEFTNTDNAVISSYYSMVFAVDNTNTVGGRSFTFAKGAKGYNNQPSSLMTILGTGQVGIGTVSPGIKLDVIGGTTLSGSAYGVIRGVQDRTDYKGAVLGYDSSGQIGIVYSESNGSPSSLAFWTYNGSTWGEKLRINGSGYVGIGTSNPQGKFHLDHGDTYHMGILSTYVSTYVTSTKFGRPSTDSNLELIYDIAGSEIAYLKRNYPTAQLRFNRGTTTDMMITGSGDLGIGTTTISWASANRRVVEINGADQVLLGIKVGDVQKGYHYHNGTNLYTENSHSGGDWYLAQVGAGNMIFSTNGSERVRITSTGAVKVEGSLKANRTIYNWYQTGTNSWDGYAYLHIKTALWGGSGGNNSSPTMSMFSAKLYSYSSSYIREGNIGFHNWSGSIYNQSTTGNIWAGAYVSSDGYVVLIVALGSGSYMGINIDWHQSYAYPFQDRSVLSTAYSNSASSLF